MTKTTDAQPPAKPVAAAKDKIVIFDTTLRDGEQCPGATMTFEEKLEVAELLDEMGVDVIEAGFPIASEGDFEAVTEIAKRVKNATVAGLARAGDKRHRPRRRGGTPCQARPHPHLHLDQPRPYASTSCRRSQDEVLAIVASSVKRARNWVEDVEWSAEDATRTEHDFLCRCRRGRDQGRRDDDQHARHRRLRRAGRVRRAVHDAARARAGHADKAIFSTHCHNDLGLAVANSLAGVVAGARQIECTINGIGERAGNAALEEIVMALKTRSDLRAVRHRHQDDDAVARSRLVSAVTNFPVQYNKAIVGRNAFAHESGIHQDGMLKHTADLRDHDAGVGRRRKDLAGHGQALGPQRLPLEAEGARLRAGRQRDRGRLQPLQGPRRPQEARLRRGHRSAGR